MIRSAEGGLEYRLMRTFSALAAASMSALWTTLALAQDITVDPASPVSSADKSTAIEWLITGLFLVFCLVVGFKPAKRSKLG